MSAAGPGADRADGGIVIGGFYEMPDGTVAKTYGWDGKGRTVAYFLDGDAGYGSVAADELESSWRRRPDLRDFPDAKDPALPYVFDLNWDAKRRSDLVPLLAGQDAEDVRTAMAVNGIVLSPDEEEAVEAAISYAAFASAAGL